MKTAVIQPKITTDLVKQGGLGQAKIGNSQEFQGLLNSLGNAPAPAAAGLAQPAGGIGNLKFSQHAVERMHSRGITFPADEMAKIQAAVGKAVEKGAKDTLVISGDKALIVNTKNQTVVTVMDRTLMKENVFTNIDSTVLV